MAYYSGQASRLQELVNTVVNHCVTEGWSWNNVVLSKNSGFFTLSVQNVGVGQTTQNVVRLCAGTGSSGTVLDNIAPIGHAIGTAIHDTTYGMTKFPIQYNLHINENHDEVYLICKYDQNFYMWLAWGANASVDGTQAPWTAGSFGVPSVGRYQTYYSRWPMIVIYEYGSSNNVDSTTAGFFWNTVYPALSNPKTYTSCLYSQGAWQTSISSVIPNQPLVQRSVSNFFNESILLPILPSIQVGSSKVQILTAIKNARYIRMSNYEPEQIINLGYEKWKVYPFYQKNSSLKDGGTYINHTGTFGWAIRYDGP